jgi:hypothetical protein
MTRRTRSMPPRVMCNARQGSFNPLDVASLSLPGGTAGLVKAAAVLGPLLLGAGSAVAKGGEYGVLEGRTVAMIHPIVMGE